ncbi:MAG TPA: hypothetical protein VLS90_03500, partial [Thermodesulfobacteriota bacterium]|nr:hypothetical protein [Thermodesulfobacteriota bacterium]
MTGEEFRSAERGREQKRADITVISANLIRWLGEAPSIPAEIAEAGKPLLEKARQKSEIRDFRVYPFGRDLHIQINT